MAELRPYPFGLLVERMLRELDASQSAFDLPLSKAFLGDPARDLAVRFHGRRASTPLGPAAGPQSQMAQNIALSWLAGSRILELKTVQVDDRLAIPRPCIDMQTVGYNVEWSQELRLEESLEEYVKGAMLVAILAERLGVPPEHAATVYDMSVGYDLAGIRGERVQAFVAGMLDCRSLVERLRREIPAAHRALRDLDFPARLSDTLTLSTFHGCPPDEIERIVDFLMRRNGLHCIVKLNPMLLGRERTRELLNGVLGYADVEAPDSAFERDTSWEAAQGFVERLGETARALGLGFGVKFSNTLIVKNHRAFFRPDQKEMYLSGPPLHVLAMSLVQRFRARFGDRWPISFSAGIDRKNFPDAVALGLVPVTVCSDWLKPGGYARGRGYFDELAQRMDAAGARTVGDFAIRAYGLGGEALDRAGLAHGSAERRACDDALRDGGDLRAAAGESAYARWVSAAVLLGTGRYAAQVVADPRYRSGANAKVPRKIGSRLELFDCISCDKCIPVCPNDANFTFVLPRLDVPIVKVRRDGARWTSREDGRLVIEEQHQIANFADFCNDCGNCDVFCPEDGGPYLVKPRFFGRVADWRAARGLDGFCLEHRPGEAVLHGRIGGREYALGASAGRIGASAGRSTFSGDGFALELDERDPLASLDGQTSVEVDLGILRVLCWIRDAVYAEGSTSYPALIAAAPERAGLV